MGENTVRSVSDQLKSQFNKQESEDPFLLLVTLSHANFGDVRFVNNTEDITSRGNVYTAFPIKITLPQDDDEIVPTIKLSMDNVSLELIDEIRSVTDPIDVKVEAILASAPDVIEIDYSNLKIRSIDYDLQTINAILFFDDILNTAIPSEKYDPQTNPGIF
jgi:hypothetical protein